MKALSPPPPRPLSTSMFLCLTFYKIIRGINTASIHEPCNSPNVWYDINPLNEWIFLFDTLSSQ